MCTVDNQLPRSALPTTAAWIELSLTKPEACTLENRTKEQRNSEEWHKARNGRLTASNFEKKKNFK
jgi:hypothetical protein